MSTNIYTHAPGRPAPSIPPRILQVLIVLAGGMALFFLFALVFWTGYGAYHHGQIFPGVSVAGIDLSGLDQTQAVERLTLGTNYLSNGKIVFQDQGKVWVATPAELGLVLDAQSSALAAYNIGRSSNLLARPFERLSAWYGGQQLPMLMIYDQRKAQDYLNLIAAEINRPTIEASLSMQGLEIVTIPGQVGRQVDLAATLAPLEGQLRSMIDGMLPIVVTETPPAVLDASQQAELARQILSAPLVLQIPNAAAGDPGPWTIEPQQLASMLSIERASSTAGVQYQIGINNQALDAYLNALAPEIARGTQNARFIFNDETHLLEVIRPSAPGRSLDIPTAIREINQRLLAGEHAITLPIAIIQPEVSDTATGEQLGITGNVAVYTSYFRGSTTERMQNIETAAANFHGLLVPPGATFSMADVMGDVSLDSGYAEAWIIFGGRTIKGVGGGVCQVSTTLFRTAFFAGYPIVERYQHAYRVGYYEQTARGYDSSLAGLDATVFVPMVDFKFVNDRPYWLLMETYFNPTARTLTWKFYSTDDGRRVEWSTSGPQNVIEPPEPQYEENPELAQGEIRQVDWAAEGADVSVTRTIYKDGQVLFTDTFNTHYLPWRDVFQYGPGTELPSDQGVPIDINP